jgi:hypothetical protein
VVGVNGEIYTWLGGNIDFDPFPLLLDPKLWRYQRITYPASALDIGGSIQAGANSLINQIQNTAGDFALGGYSQGASTVANVYSACRSGVLANRRSNLKAIVTFGSPSREVNSVAASANGYAGAIDIPGSTRGSHGLFPNRIQGTESFVQDWVMPGDVITAVGDSFYGNLWTQASGFLQSNNLVAALATFVAAAGMVTAAATTTTLTDVVTGRPFSLPGGGHTLYPFLPPPNSDGSPGSGLTCYQRAAVYLNTVGQQIYDQANPTVPSPTTKPTYQWFSSLANG